MKLDQPFLEIEKRKGMLKFTLGDSFGKSLRSFVLLLFLLSLTRTLPDEYLPVILKAIVEAAKQWL